MNVQDDLSRLGDLLRGRRTVNFFTDQPVDHRLVADAVEVARWAPNHRLTEPWKFFHLGARSKGQVIELAVELAKNSKGDAAALSRRNRLQAVPEWIAVTSAISEDPLLDREDYAATSCAIQNLMLYLWQGGVGSKWTTGAVTRLPETLQILGLDPAEHRIAGLIWMGYPRQATESTRAELKTVFSRLD
ncbi:MAG: nitroreductase [Lysobacterales bacterium]